MDVAQELAGRVNGARLRYGDRLAVHVARIGTAYLTGPGNGATFRIRGHESVRTVHRTDRGIAERGKPLQIPREIDRAVVEHAECLPGRAAVTPSGARPDDASGAIEVD